MDVGLNLFSPTNLSGLFSRKITPAVSSSSKSGIQDVLALSSSAGTSSASSGSSSSSKNKKTFKNLKEYRAYVMLVYQKLQKIKPEAGGLYVRLEDKAEYSKLTNELNSLRDVNILS